MWMNQRRVGVAVKYFRRRVSIVFAAQVLTLSALAALACWLDLDRGRRGAFLVAGVLAVAITIVFGRWTRQGAACRLPGPPVTTAARFDEIVHAPNRLQICAMLAAVESADFPAVREGLGVAD